MIKPIFGWLVASQFWISVTTPSEILPTQTFKHALDSVVLVTAGPFDFVCEHYWHNAGCKFPELNRRIKSMSTSVKQSKFLFYSARAGGKIDQDTVLPLFVFLIR